MKRIATICAICILAGVLLRNAPGLIGDIFATGALCGATLLLALPLLALSLKRSAGNFEGLEHIGD